MSTSDGAFIVGTAQDVGAYQLQNPVNVPIPEGRVQVFGPLEPTKLSQATNATADFPWSGLDMQAGGSAVHQVDGVIGVDVPALASLD